LAQVNAAHMQTELKDVLPDSGEAVRAKIKEATNVRTKLGRRTLLIQTALLATLMALDMGTDWAVCIDWLLDSSTVWWGLISLITFLLAGLAQVPVGLIMDADHKSSVSRLGRQSVWSRRGLLSAAVSLVGFRPLAEMFRYAWKVGVERNKSLAALSRCGYDLSATCYGMGVIFAQIVACSFQAAPMLILGSYIMVYNAVNHDVWDGLLVVSIIVSVISMAVNAGLNYSRGFQTVGESTRIRVAAVLHALMQIALRVTSTSFFAVEFGPLLFFYLAITLFLTGLHVYHVHVVNNLQGWPFWVGTLVSVLPCYYIALDTTDRDGPVGLNLYNCWVSNTMLSPRASTICFVRVAEGFVVFHFLLAVPPLPGRKNIPSAAAAAGLLIPCATCLSYFCLRWVVVRKHNSNQAEVQLPPSGMEPLIYSIKPDFDMGFLTERRPCWCRRAEAEVVAIVPGGETEVVAVVPGETAVVSRQL